MGITDESRQVLPIDFHEWVAYRLHYYESTSGWRNMILESCQGDESKALERFFELVDDYLAREERVVARVTGIDVRYTCTRIPEGGTLADGVTTEERYPTAARLVVYTDDPGFFAYSEEPGRELPFPLRGFCPTLNSFEQRVMVDRSRFEVLEPAVFERWGLEELKRKIQGCIV